MSVQQMVAWFNLSIAILSAAAYLLLWAMIGPWRAMGAFGLLGFAGFSVLFYRKSKVAGRVAADERDTQIGIKAVAAAKSVVWVTLIAAFLIAMQFFGEDGAVPIRILGLMIWLSFCAFLIVQSIATLILYARQ
jgi:hypothetical protein